MVKIFVLTGTPITLGLLIFAEQAMMVFGSEFIEGAWTMRIYVAGVLVTLLFGPGSAVLVMTGNEGTASRILVISLCIHVVLAIILIPLAGIVGCASASFLSLCFLAAASRLMVIKKVGIESSLLTCFSRNTRLGKS